MVILENKLFHLIIFLALIIVHLRSPHFSIGDIGLSELTSAGFLSWLLVFYNLAFLGLLGLNVFSSLRDDEVVNSAKLLLFLSSFAFITLVLNSGWFDDLHYLVYLAIFTIHHNIQYFGITFHFNRLKNTSNKLFSRLLAGNISFFIAFSIVCAVILFSARWVLAGALEFEHFKDWGEFVIFKNSRLDLKRLLLVFFSGFAMQHYFLDQKIWKLKDMKQILQRENHL